MWPKGILGEPCSFCSTSLKARRQLSFCQSTCRYEQTLGGPCNAPRLTNLALLDTQLLIFLSSVIFITESLPRIRADQEMLANFHVSCASRSSNAWMHCSVVVVQVAEWICILHFTVDYCMRIATCTRRPSHDKTLWGYAKQVRPQQGDTHR